jgi:uncharacterized membrane protein YqjE
MAEPGERKQGVFASVGRILKTLVATGHNRLELVLVELEEERWRFFNTLLLAGMFLVLAAMTLMVATIAIVVTCLQAGRVDLVVALIVLYLVATVICYWRLRSGLKQKVLFSATRAELRKDKACWEEKS